MNSATKYIKKKIYDWLAPQFPNAGPPQRYVQNICRYRDRGGSINLAKEIDPFIRDSANNRGDLARLYSFCLAFDQIEKDNVPGDLAEIGVYQGHTAVLLARFCRRVKRELYLLDTFDGFALQDIQTVDGRPPDHFKDSSLKLVQSFVGKDRVHYIQGWFPETETLMPENKSYSLVHIDCDLHAPILAALSYFYPRTSPKGFIIVHDYSSLHWPGAEQAVDEFFADKPENIVLMPDISGSIIVRKQK